VLPIGGLREKTLAAHRGGITTFILPKRNAKDLDELPDVVKEGLELIEVSSLDEVLEIALMKAGKRRGRKNATTPPTGEIDDPDSGKDSKRKPPTGGRGRKRIEAPGLPEPVPASVRR
jgi:hypothetical protein